MVRLTPVVRNILIANIIVFVLQQMMSGSNFTAIMSLWKFGSDNFAPYQFFTYMFAHGGFGHILFNMLGLIFLGPLLEQFWGPKRFLTFYLVTGIGAGILYNAIEFVQVNKVKQEVAAYIANPDPEAFNRLVANNDTYLNPEVYEFVDRYAKDPENDYLEEQTIRFAREFFNAKLNIGSMLGASGAIYGILMAFGLLFPNTELMLLIPPIPVKAKYLVLVLGGIALYSSINRNPDDVTAHIAHLGGMIFAFIMIKIWQRGKDRFY